MPDTLEIPALLPALPEIVLVLGAMALLMVGAFRGEQATKSIDGAAILLLILTGAVIVWLPAGKLVTFGGSFVVDNFARFLKLLALTGSAAAILMSTDYLAAEKRQRFEYSILILLATTGMMMLISAADLIALYLGLELMSLSLYVVAAIDRDSVRSTEAGLKYFVLGALSSGMLLYGASLVYGFTGTVSFAGIAKAATQGGASAGHLGLLFGLVFLFAGFCFKVSAVPFHMWTPDVYEGAPTPITAFFAAAPKVAGIAMFVRTTIVAFPGVVAQWQQIVVFVAIASMALGAFAAIGQRNIKRLMAYSSIGHMGFALVGLAAGTQEGVQGVLVYMAIYVAMTLGTFACILSMRRDGQMVENISDLSGLARTKPAMAFFFAMLLFSLAGIPPLAGFFAKFYVFLAAIQAGLFTLAVIGVVTSVVGAYYYLTIVKIMYFEEPANRSSRCRSSSKGCLRSPACSISCSSSIQARWLMRPTRRRSRCSECSLILNETGRQGERGGRAACCARGAWLDQRGSLEPCASRRARPALGGRRSADRRPRAARPHLDIAARQSLRQPVAYGVRATGALAGTFVRRRARGARCGRGGRSRPQAAAGDQVAQRSGAGRRQVRRHPDRRGERRGRHRHRHQLRRSPRRHGLSRYRSRHGRCAGFARRLVRCIIGQDDRTHRAMEWRGGLLDRPRGLVRARSRGG